MTSLLCPIPTCAVGCRDRKLDRVAIAWSLASCFCVEWRGITDALWRNRGWQGSIVLVDLTGRASESEPALSTEAPVDTAAWQHDAGDVAAELLLQGGPPGHEPEAEAIIDHREPTGGQR